MGSAIVVMRVTSQHRHLTVSASNATGRSQLFAWAVAVSAWLSLLPYFLWSHREAGLFAAALIVGSAAIDAWWDRRGESFAARDVLAAVGLALFLVYITAQPTVGGGHSPWVFVLPTVAAIFAARGEDRALAFSHFELIFVLSLIPGIITLLLMVAGVPVAFSVRPPPTALFAATGHQILEGFGAVFIDTNSQLLPWGGLLSRLCGMYDEPGMVGTTAALMLAARRFDVRCWRGVLLWIAGTLSLSLAFVVLGLLGFGIRTVTRREWKPTFLAVPVVLGGLLALGILRPTVSDTVVPRVNVTAPSGVAEPLHFADARVRQVEVVNNRSRPEMDALLQRYLASNWPTLLFGIASDASVVYGGASAVWTRVLTNHGLIGLTLLAVVFVGYAISALRRTPDLLGMAVFLVCFALSFYQRPVIWLPYNLLLFFGAVAVLEAPHHQRGRPRDTDTPHSSSAL